MGRKELGAIREKYVVVGDVLEERGRRVWAAAEARSLPFGGVSLVARATGLSRTTVHAGMRVLKAGQRRTIGTGRSRKTGGGRKPLTYHNPDLLGALQKLVEPATPRDPDSPLRWTCKITRHLSLDMQRPESRSGA